MGLLFVNACLREGSRTDRLARMWLERYGGDFQEVALADRDVAPLGADTIGNYCDAVATARYDGALFDAAHQFAAATEILIAAPLWNFALPAKLHDYLEVVCSQGVTFDVDEKGRYVSLTHAHRLVYVGTSGGCWPDEGDDHAFGYLKTLSRVFWHIERVDRVVADGLDIEGCDVEQALAAALARSM